MTADLMMSNAAAASYRPVNTQVGGTSQTKIKATARQFEAQFMTQMLEHMFTGIDQEKGLFGGGHAEAMFRPMLLDEYGKMIANKSDGRGHTGMGIGNKVAQVLLAQQEVRQ